MFMFSYLILVLAILGVYTEIYAVQTAKLFSKQNVVASAMVTWHKTAVKKAATSGLSVAAGDYCMMTAGEAKPCVATSQVAAGDFVNSSYNTASYSWFTVAYNISGQTYIVTYVPPTAATVSPQNNLIIKPNVGISIAELSMQLRRVGLDPATYGMVSGSSLQTNTSISFPVNTTAIADKSVAIVSMP